jgi:hypothetical protein
MIVRLVADIQNRLFWRVALVGFLSAWESDRSWWNAADQPTPLTCGSHE